MGVCLFVQNLDPEAEWVVARQKACCGYKGEKFDRDYAYAGFEGFSFVGKKLEFILSVTILPPVRDLKLNFFISLEEEISDF